MNNTTECIQIIKQTKYNTSIIENVYETGVVEEFDEQKCQKTILDKKTAQRKFELAQKEINNIFRKKGYKRGMRGAGQ